MNQQKAFAFLFGGKKLKASKAREISLEEQRKKEEQELKAILDKILERAIEGEKDLCIDNLLYKTTKANLETLGYKFEIKKNITGDDIKLIKW